MSLNNDIKSNAIPPVIAGLFIATETTSILLLSLALTLLLRSKPFITRRSLFQYLVASIMQKVSIILVLILDSAFSSQDNDEAALYCIIQAYCSGFLEYGIAMIPAVLGIYLCFAILKNIDLERRIYTIMTSLIWLVAIIGTFAQMIGSLEQPFAGVRFNLDGCTLSSGRLGNWKLWSVAPILMFTSVGLSFAVISLYGLFSIWRRQIERTVLKSVYAIVLTITCLIITLTRVTLNFQSIHHLSELQPHLWSANRALKFVMAIFGPIFYTIYIILQTNTSLCCNTKEIEEEENDDVDDDNLEEATSSWPSLLTLINQQGRQKTTDLENAASMEMSTLGKSSKK